MSAPTNAPSPPPTKPIPVLLLKTKSTPKDNYEEYFSRDGGFAPQFVPVLEHTFNAANLQKLRRLLTEGNDGVYLRDGDTRYGGLIFTSQRAVEAFAVVVREVGAFASSPDLACFACLNTATPGLYPAPGPSNSNSGGIEGASKHLLTHLPTHPSDCTVASETPNTTSNPLSQLALPLYVVGPATSRALHALMTTHLACCAVLGAETGNGENLAAFILDHFHSLSLCLPRHDGDGDGGRDRAEPKPTLLFLVGEQRRDVIPRTLSSSTLAPARRIAVDEMVVYESGLLGSFAADLAGVLEGSGMDEGEGEVGWVVVFSPTGCRELLGVLGVGREGEGRQRKRRKFFVATIGPTTRDYLVREFGFEPDVCAERPSPEGVEEGMRRFLEGRGLFAG